MIIFSSENGHQPRARRRAQRHHHPDPGRQRRRRASRRPLRRPRTGGPLGRPCRCCSSAYIGARRDAIPPATIRKLISNALAPTGLKDATGKPLAYLPHDFRRFLHRRHPSTACCPRTSQLRAPRHQRHPRKRTRPSTPTTRSAPTGPSSTRRRPCGPPRNTAPPPTREWEEFPGHFEMPQVALGTCGRPYGTPCIHEHAPLTELTTMFRQFMAGFRLLALTCPRDRIG